jgi:ABC-type multidrug transport system ATPase subunit
VSDAALVSASSIHKSYGPNPVLRGVSFQVGPGELTGIVGENGAGKTTLLRILRGELRADSGTVALSGKLGYCPQHPVLHDELTVNQHLHYFQVAHRLSTVDLAVELIDRLNFTQYRTKMVKHLSGGTKQKLNLVLALMNDPDVVLLDEPYQGFDWETYLRFWDIAADLRRAGRAIVVISHLAYDSERLDVLHRLRDGVLDLAPNGSRA